MIGTILRLSTAALATLLASCGGDGSSTQEPTTYPLRQAYDKLLQDGETGTFAISGSCIGTAFLKDDPEVSTTYEGLPALGIPKYSTFIYTNCSPQQSVTLGTNYYTLDHRLLAVTTTTSSAISVVAPTEEQLPVAVKVGDLFVRGTATTYADNTRAKILGQIGRRLTIEPDTTSTVIVNFISETFGADGVLSLTVQSKYRMNAAGSLTKISIEYQFQDALRTHLLLVRL